MRYGPSVAPGRKSGPSSNNGAAVAHTGRSTRNGAASSRSNDSTSRRSLVAGARFGEKRVERGRVMVDGQPVDPGDLLPALGNYIHLYLVAICGAREASEGPIRAAIPAAEDAAYTDT